MSTCCETSAVPAESASAGKTTVALTVALAGNPNSGKTTIFNALTGLRQKVANYPGVTVEKKTGRVVLDDGRGVELIDLPGTYSLVSRSPDEVVAMEVLRGLRPDVRPLDAVIVVVDASNLQRNLYLVSQLIEVGLPMVVALNMMDIAERRGQHVSAERLEKALGVPVIPVVGHKRKGINELKSAIARAKSPAMPDWPLPDAMKQEISRLADQLSQVEPAKARRAAALAERLLIGDPAVDLQAWRTQHQAISTTAGAAHQRLSAMGIDPMQADIEAHYHWIEQTASAALVPACEQIGAEKPVLNYATKPPLTDRVDRILVHKFFGLLIFAAIMGTIFVSLFWLADPIMGMVEGVVGWLGDLVTPLLPEGTLRDLWTDGIVAGVGGVVVFVPQIAILFFFLAILEDSGYLARAAFLMDRLLKGVGLHGKSFIPLLSSFACAIPGIMAARTIEDRRDRLATIFVAPFMSCSARLPVYILLIGTFFAGFSALGQAGIMLALYALGVLAAAGTAWIFRRSLLKGSSSAFILELPTYKIPQASQVARTVWTNTWAFLYRAGTIIFALSIILWAMAYYPRLPDERVTTINSEIAEQYGPIYDRIMKIKAGDVSPGDEPWLRSLFVDYALSGIQYPGASTPHFDDRGDPFLREHLHFRQPIAYGLGRAGWESVVSTTEMDDPYEITEKQIAAEQLRHSISGRLGHAMEPVIKPLGYDWKMGVGLIAAFAAREVFVSHMGIIYSVGEAEDDTAELESAMMADTYADGTPVWSIPVAISLLVWFVLAMQCMSTVAIVRRETGGWRWPLFMILYMNSLAYVLALIVYQVGIRIAAA